MRVLPWITLIGLASSFAVASAATDSDTTGAENINSDVDLLSRTALAEWAALTKKLKGQYPDANKLSLSTLGQLDKIEDLRKVDIKNNVKGAKETVDGMRRKITPFAGMELPDPKYLVSHVGHDMQRFDKKRWSRLLSSAVVMRTNEQGQHQIVFFIKLESEER
ncbi:hypothetical protein GQ600_14041 [Phytophthora cactorum]|nr:hypothetical protein GQ600_14041 [Phytophthora cactorum]